MDNNPSQPWLTWQIRYPQNESGIKKKTFKKTEIKSIKKHWKKIESTQLTWLTYDSRYPNKKKSENNHKAQSPIT
jgi:hypothetical protein